MAENEALWILQFSDGNWGMRCHLMRYATWVPVIIIISKKKKLTNTLKI